jgi:hypothetical protein
MSTETVDALLAEWDERLRRIDESLLALEAEPTYQMLAPRAQPRTPLEGETARVVTSALDALDQVFEHRGKLTEILDRAKELRRSMGGFWGNDDKEREIVALLQGPSIELPQETTPLARRALLDPGSRDVRAVPEQVLVAMAQAFERARDAVVAVQQAWARSEPELARLETQIGESRANAASMGIETAVEPELATASREIDVVRVALARDPLGASTGLVAQARARVEAVRGQLESLAALRDRVAAGLGRAAGMLVRLREVHQEAKAAVVALPREVEGASAPRAPNEDGLVDALGPWLQKLEQVAREGRYAAADVGLAKWTSAATGYLANDDEIASALTGVVARRDELRGRLEARRAQAQGLKAKGAPLDPAVEDIAHEAEKLLASRPTPLARAAALVERYESALKGRR